MIEFSGRMSRVFLKKIQLFFIFFEKTAKTPLPATMSTLYQHSAPPAPPPRPGNFFREARNFSRRRENFPRAAGNFPPRRQFFLPDDGFFPRKGAFFSPGDNFFAPAEDFFMPRGRFPYVEGRPAAVLQAGRGLPRAIYAPIYAYDAPYMPSGRSIGGPPRRIHRQEACWKRSQYAFLACIFAIYLEQSNKEFSTELFSATPV